MKLTTPLINLYECGSREQHPHNYVIISMSNFLYIPVINIAATDPVVITTNR
jgi:hypothetical protein